MSDYVFGQLSSAFRTASTNKDPAVRKRAEQRVQQWTQLLDNAADGKLSVGSRTPVAGLPAWVTLEVLRGGFATGGAVAGGYAGNEVEKNVNKHTVYKTTVKMDDGSTRQLTVSHAYAIGAKVSVNGTKLKLQTP